MIVLFIFFFFLCPCKKRMATRGRPTVDPAKITNIDSWLKYYKLRYGNVVLGEGGLYLVLDPALSRTDTKAARAAPIKTIPHIKGYDYVSVLADPTSSTMLRAAAEERHNTEKTNIDAAVTIAQNEYGVLEHELLAAVDQWNSAGDATMRKIAAMRVGDLSKQLAAADEQRRLARYPKGYIYTEEGLLRRQVNYASHDDRVIKHDLYRFVPESTSAARLTFFSE